MRLPLEYASRLPRELKIQTPEQYRFCNDDQPLGLNSAGCSLNQRLVGAANPKTLTAPLIVPPALSWEFWGDDMTVPSGINDTSREYIGSSGYLANGPIGAQCVYRACDDESGGQSVYSTTARAIQVNNDRTLFEGQDQPHTIKHTTAPTNNRTLLSSLPSAFEGAADSKEGYNGSREGNGYSTCSGVTPVKYLNEFQEPSARDGDIISCRGYDPSGPEYGLPVNSPPLPALRSPDLSTYNQSIYTTPIQPGVAAYTNVTFPPQSNIGISATAQYPPSIVKETCAGTLYEYKDPRKHSEPPTGHRDRGPQPDTVYDPRSNGAGTSYRTYIHKMTGQPRFYYDDVDAIRRPNFIVRSNVDHAPWAQTYGPIASQYAGGDTASAMDPSHRTLAHDTFLEGALKHRSELMERSMRKYNTEIAWQRRVAPIRQF